MEKVAFWGRGGLVVGWGGGGGASSGFYGMCFSCISRALCNKVISPLTNFHFKFLKQAYFFHKVNFAEKWTYDLIAGRPRYTKSRSSISQEGIIIRSLSSFPCILYYARNPLGQRFFTSRARLVDEVEMRTSLSNPRASWFNRERLGRDCTGPGIRS